MYGGLSVLGLRSAEAPNYKQTLLLATRRVRSADLIACMQAFLQVDADRKPNLGWPSVCEA